MRKHRAFFVFTRSDLALPERALRRSILQLRTPVRACRLSLAKPARLCDIALYSVGWRCGASARTACGRICSAQGASKRYLWEVLGNFERYWEFLGVEQICFVVGRGHAAYLLSPLKASQILPSSPKTSHSNIQLSTRVSFPVRA